MGPAGVVLLVLAIAGCQSRPSDGVWHEVRAGETAYSIARYYRVPVGTLIETNGIDDVTRLAVGERLWIPGADRGQTAGAPPPAAAQARRLEAQGDALTSGNHSFAWPLRGRISSKFGKRGDRMHEGIDLVARSGTLVRASESGRVIYSGTLGAYGKVVILRHSPAYTSVYAHNRRNRVAKGAYVDKGAVVAEVGATGNATGPHLHFEIRRDDRAQDPLLFLP